MLEENNRRKDAIDVKVYRDGECIGRMKYNRRESFVPVERFGVDARGQSVRVASGIGVHGDAG